MVIRWSRLCNGFPPHPDGWRCEGERARRAPAWMRKPLQEGKMATLEGSPARRLAVCGAAVLALTGFAGVRGVMAGDPGTPESAAHHTLLAINAGEVEEGQL